ncbi:MAG: transcription elongation factor GreA [bacterium]
MNDEETILLTEVGYRKLEAELHELSTVRRPEVAEQIRNSKEHGEFSDDNSEFENAKLDQAMVEGRINELRQMLALATIVHPDAIPTDYVGIGSIVTVKDIDNNTSFDLVVVGLLEADPDNDRISHQAPVGEALFGREVGEIVEVVVPAGKLNYQIEAIRK